MYSNSGVPSTEGKIHPVDLAHLSVIQIVIDNDFDNPF